MRRTFHAAGRPLVALAMGLCLCLLPVRAGAVMVSVAPADTSVDLGATFTLRVVTTSFADLKGFQLIHAFDPAKMVLNSIVAGDVLTGTGRPYAAFTVADAQAPVDSTWLDAAVLMGATSGPGVLAYLTFTSVAAGDAAVSCEHVEFRDSGNALTLPDCVPGMVRVLGPVPSRRWSWGAVKSMYR